MKLTAKGRKALPKSDFAVPSKRTDGGGKGGYPIENKGHAKAALARADEFGSPKLKAEVREKVERKFPGMEVKGKEPSNLPGKGGVPTGAHYQANHRAPESHDEFHKLGNPGDKAY